MQGTYDQVLAKQQERLLTIAQNSCFYSADRVPKATRKYSGQARASINMGVGSRDNSVVRVTNYAPNAISGEIGLATRKFKAASQRISLSGSVYISSALEYMPVIEYQYGDLMFTNAAAQWVADVNRAVNDAK